MSTIEIEGQKVQLSTAPDGEITASSAAFAVYVVQQVTGGGGGITPLPLPAWVEYAWEADSGVTVNMSSEVTEWACRLTGLRLIPTAFAGLPTLGVAEGCPVVITDTSGRVLVTESDINFVTGDWASAWMGRRTATGATHHIFDSDPTAVRFGTFVANTNGPNYAVCVNVAGTGRTASAATLSARQPIQVMCSSHITPATGGLVAWAETDGAMVPTSTNTTGVARTGNRAIMFGARAVGYPFTGWTLGAAAVTYGVYLARNTITQTQAEEMQAYLTRKRAIFLATTT